MYAAGKGIKFYRNGNYTCICADISLLTSSIDLSSYARLSDVLSI